MTDLSMKMGKSAKREKPMRILFVSNGYPPYDTAGVEAHTHAICRELLRRGHEPIVFFRVADPSREEFSAIDEKIEGIQTRQVVNNIRYEGDFLLHYRNEKVNDHFDQFVAETQPDAIHIQHSIGLGSGMASVAAGHGYRPLLTLHDYWHFCHRIHFILPDGEACNEDRFAEGAGCIGCGDVLDLYTATGRREGVARKMLRKGGKALPFGIRRALKRAALERGFFTDDVAREALRRQFMERVRYLHDMAACCSLIISPSYYLRDQYLKCGFDDLADRFEVWPHGIDIPTRRRTFDRPPEIVRFGYVGSLMEHKGIAALLRAFGSLPKGSAKLKIYGGCYWDWLLEKFHKMGSAVGAEFMGAVPRDEIYKAYSEIDVLVVPSNWPETFCLSVREAMASGVPAIVSRIGALTEGVMEGVDGLYCSPGDPVDLAEKMKLLIDRPERIVELSKGLRPQRTIADYVDRLEEAYAREIERGPLAAAQGRA